VAHAMTLPTLAQRYLLAIAALTLLRFAAAARLPLSADEAYYWLWSRHLAAGYFDHPPAIAFVIRAGTVLFGDTALGVRFGALILSVVASAFVWQSAAILLKDELAAARACLFFNLTLLVSVETLAATPDAPAVATAAAFLFATAKVWQSESGRWWLAVGVAAGLSLLSKYTGFFLGAGVLAWLIFSPKARRWFVSPWPYLGGLLALAIFLPNLLWNSSHGWATFVFQLSRIGAGHLTFRFLAEFLGVQILLATPFIFALAALGMAFSSRDRDSATFLLAALVFPSAVYFLVHSLHDRIQGNWPCFLYPALAVAAAEAVARTDWSGWTVPIWRISRRLAVPVATFLLVAVYAQALFGIVPLGRSDPLARLLAVGMEDVTGTVERLAAQDRAAAILTTDYASTAWLSFALPAHPKIVQLNEEQRYQDAPRPDRSLLSSPLLYVVEQRLDRHDFVAAHFTDVTPIAHVDRLRKGVAIAHYVIYRVAGLRGAPLGRMP
jgi:4-amino-4-deoxy-L-arabinose transferase-like glycosyltransferase